MIAGFLALFVLGLLAAPESTSASSAAYPKYQRCVAWNYLCVTVTHSHFGYFWYRFNTNIWHFNVLFRWRASDPNYAAISNWHVSRPDQNYLRCWVGYDSKHSWLRFTYCGVDWGAVRSYIWSNTYSILLSVGIAAAVAITMLALLPLGI